MSKVGIPPPHDSEKPHALVAGKQKNSFEEYKLFLGHRKSMQPSEPTILKPKRLSGAIPINIDLTSFS